MPLKDNEKYIINEIYVMNIHTERNIHNVYINFVLHYILLLSSLTAIISEQLSAFFTEDLFE